ncbi:MAG: aspartate--tRNA ligase [Acidobacteria bacterium]|nr:aspartate--tRNA ligase [Acidobacteriota bacterium]MBV9069644.1 aspartate--tRNA ligase [Acidobacteriota bacterium]MBV9184144.1 aspartate--tRNA ligase [Acidobacteriota bacterium]
MNRTYAGTLDKSHAGSAATIAGWVQKQRDFGELVFIDVRDRSGIVQVVVDRSKGASEELLAIAKELRSEFVLRVAGEVRERSESTKNSKMPTGEIEIVATSIELLSRADTPPFPVDDEVDAAEDLRLKYRYLDLRRPALARNIILRDRIAHGVRDYMHRQGFLEIETPILTKSTPEGARDYLVPSRVHKGTFYALPQSPQIFKQLLMVSGLDRYYQIARCFRDEDLRRDRQPEFTQVDIEASFIDEEFVFTLIEGMFAEVFPLAGIPITTPFPRMGWQEAMDRFGIDRPDTRFGMELIDITAAAKAIDFAAFREAETVRGIVVPRGSSLSRRQIDDLSEEAKKLGASGLVWMKFDGLRGSSIKKFLDDAKFDSLRDALRANFNDLALIVAGKTTRVWDVLGSLRLKLGKEQGLIPGDRWDFLWVVDFPLFEWDEESGRFFARHHPFTSPRLEDVEKIESDPGATLARAYDVVMNGLELGGGSIRINTPELQSRMFRALGISDEDARDRFGFLIDAFRYGAPPHGGVALGFDRMVMLMARAESLREVIAFPKTARAQDLLSEAPSRVDEKQLDELGIALKRPS